MAEHNNLRLLFPNNFRSTEMAGKRLTLLIITSVREKTPMPSKYLNKTPYQIF